MSVSLVDGHIDSDAPRMTDNEIIKAFEHCELDHGCWGCPLAHTQGCQGVAKEILDLINRQKAEIERLQNILLKFMDEVARWEAKKGIDVSELPLIPICDKGRDAIDHHRAVAIKQFAERLKNKKLHIEDEGQIFKMVHCYEIDNLVKEMVGDTCGQ